jgi:hypothetical protein
MNAARFSGQISSVVEAVRMIASSRYEWLGTPVEFAQSTGSSDADRVSLLRNSLAGVLYRYFYAPGHPVRAGETFQEGPDDELAQAMARANVAPAFVDWGWQINGHSGETSLVEKDGLMVQVPTDELVITTGSEQVGVRFASGYPNASPGFFLITSESGPAPDFQGVRVYWNLAPEGRVRLLESLSRALSDATIPFALKALTIPEAVQRADSCVLYVERRAYARWRPLVSEVYAALHPYVREGIPGFTKSIADGLAIGEDPGRNASFGEHRCGLIARGLAGALVDGRDQAGTRAAIRAELLEAGLDPSAPYLAPGSTDVYAVERVRSRSRPRRASATAPTTPIDLAVHAGDLLARRAIMSGGRATWISPVLQSNAPVGGHWSSLGSGAYDGLAGIVFYLTELWLALSRPADRDLALAAARQAIVRLDDVPASARFGFHTGWTGTLAICARLARITEHKPLVLAIRKRWRTLTAETDVGVPFDLLSGLSGGILGALCLAEALGDSHIAEQAEPWASALVARARGRGGKVWWTSPMPSLAPMIGLSHGASGAALALVTTARRTGVETYLQVAERAIAYEDSQFDASRQNWPDFRKLYPGKRTSDYVVYWCHGAPGIGLVRASAVEATGKVQHATQLAAARVTTEHEIERLSRASAVDVSLCHGLAGLVSVLHRTRGENREPESISLQSARERIMRELPRLIGGDRLPAFMLGPLGAVHALLESVQPGSLSILDIRPERWGIDVAERSRGLDVRPSPGHQTHSVGGSAA